MTSLELEQRWLEGQEVRRIFCVSLNDTKKKFKAYAVFDGEKLVIQRIEEIKGWFGTWKDPLIEEVRLRRGQGFEVLIEEMTDHVARHATQFRFEDLDMEENRIHWFVALDWFFSMHGMGLITVPRGAEPFLIKEQIASKKRDEKGRVEYDLNWEVLNGGHRVVLLCVMACVLSPVSDEYLQKFFKPALGEEAFNPLKTWRAITIGHDRMRAERWEPDIAKNRGDR